MKRFLLFGLLLIHPAANGVEKGASRDAVIAELGEPDGVMKSSGKEILLYKTGAVTLQNGKVIEADLSQEYAKRAEERARRAREIREVEQAELDRLKQIYPEDHIIQVSCLYDGTEEWEFLPEALRPAKGKYLYDVYIPQGYYESADRSFPCLFLEAPVFWDGVKERVRKEKWITVILHDAPQQQIGKAMNGNFLAAFDDATERFRISKGKIFLAGRVPAAIFATMRPAAGIILQDPDFKGFAKAGFKPDFLRKNPNLRAYALLGNTDRENVVFQGDFIVLHIPRHYVGVYEGSDILLPKPFSDGAIDWMKKEYNIP